MKTININIEDKQFELKQLSATQLFNFVNYLLRLISKNPNSDIIEKVVHGLMSSGIATADKEIPEGMDYLTLLLSAIKSLLAELDDAGQIHLTNEILKCATHMNGVVEMQCTYNVLDSVFMNPTSIYKLLFECVKFNFSFFSLGAKQN